jgi:hypothetical protein
MLERRSLPYLSVLIPGLVAGAAATLAGWLGLWARLPVPSWLTSILFCAGALTAVLCGYWLRRRHPQLSQIWTFAAVFVSVGLAYLFPEALAPGCGGMPRALAGCQTECRTQCEQVCTRWVPLDDPRCTNHPSPWDIGCCLRYAEDCTQVCTTTCWDDPPQVSASPNCSSPGSNGWCAGDASLTISAIDPQGYALAIGGDRGGEDFFCPSTSCTIPLPQGTGTVNYTAIAETSGLTASGSSGWMRDSLPPQLSGSVGGTSGAGGWFVSQVVLSASALDPAPGSGLATFEASVDGGGWSAYAGPIALSDGSHSVGLRALDSAGNLASTSQAVRVDTQPPQLSLAAPGSFCPGCGGRLAVRYDLADATSGPAGWELSVDGVAIDNGTGAASGTLSWNGRSISTGGHTLTLSAWDAAGNLAEVSQRFRAEAPPAPTSAIVMPVPDVDLIQPLPPRSTRTPGPQSVMVFGGPDPTAAAIVPEPGSMASPDPAAASTQPVGAASSQIVWGAAAAAATAAALAYAEEQRKRNQPRVTVTVRRFRRALPAQQPAAPQAPSAASRPAGAPGMTQAALLHGGASAQAWINRDAGGPPRPLPAGMTQAALLHGGASAQAWINRSAGSSPPPSGSPIASGSVKGTAKQSSQAKAQKDDPWWMKALQRVAEGTQALAAYYGPAEKPAAASGQVWQPFPALSKPPTPNTVFDRYFVDQSPKTGSPPSPWPSMNECVTAATIQAMNIAQDIAARVAGVPPEPHTDLEGWAREHDTGEWRDWIIRPPAETFFVGGMMHPYTAAWALKDHAASLRQETGCGYEVMRSSGNSVDDLYYNIEHGYPTTLHLANYIPNPKGLDILPALLGGMPHTVTVAGYNANTDTWYILDPGDSRGLATWSTPELMQRWGRRFLLYPPRFSMTTIIPDITCPMPVTAVPAPVAPTGAPTASAATPPAAQTPGSPPPAAAGAPDPPGPTGTPPPP